MRVVVGLDALAGASDPGTALTIGTFDGVHLGHRALMAHTVEQARARALQAAALTWDRHPAATLRPEAVPALITTPERKVELIGETGLDLLAVLPFDRELSSWPPERFALEVVHRRLSARVVAVGEDWRFGRKAAGDVALLARLGRELGFDVHPRQLVEAAGGPVSSSRVRQTVARGDMVAARTLLGRPFDVDGLVVAGDRRGADLGYPTANLRRDPALLLPTRGVYAGRARVDEVWYDAAINIGVNPTFGGDPAAEPRVEAYLLDFAGDLYGKTLRVEFHHRLRDERAFDSPARLIEQMSDDVARTRELLG